MGVISCRDKEVSLIPLYTWYELKLQRIDATGSLEPKGRGRNKCVPGVGESLRDCIERDSRHQLSRDRADSSTKKQGADRENRPSCPPVVGRETRRQRHQFYLGSGAILPEQRLFATRYRVDCRRINTRVVALGENLLLIAAERPHCNQAIYELKRRRNVKTGTSECHCRHHAKTRTYKYVSGPNPSKS